MSDGGERLRTWRVEGTVPAETGGRAYRRNVNLIAYALTLEAVVQAVREKHPGMVFIKVMGDRWAEDVIVVSEQSDEGQA